MTTWTHLYHLDGRPIASTHSLSMLQKWPWIAGHIMAEYECDSDDIDTDDTGDITVHGILTAFTETEVFKETKS